MDENRQDVTKMDKDAAPLSRRRLLGKAVLGAAADRRKRARRGDRPRRGKGQDLRKPRRTTRATRTRANTAAAAPISSSAVAPSCRRLDQLERLVQAVQGECLRSRATRRSPAAIDLAGR